MLNWDKEIQLVCFIYSLRNEHWKWSSNLVKQILRNATEVRMLKWWCGSQTSCQSEVNSAFRLFLQSSGSSPASRPAKVSPLLRPQRCWVFRGRTKSEHLCTNCWVWRQWKLLQCLEVNRCWASPRRYEKLRKLIQSVHLWKIASSEETHLQD